LYPKIVPVSLSWRRLLVAMLVPANPVRSWSGVVVVDKDEMADAEVGELLDDMAAAATEADDRDR
jgi:hypothetical protein